MIRNNYRFYTYFPSIYEFQKHIPFSVKRFFIVKNVKSKYVRGEHAHKVCKQLLVALSGSVDILIDNGVDRFTASLNSPKFGVLIENLVWSSQFNFSKDAILGVFASDNYDEDDDKSRKLVYKLLMLLLLMTMMIIPTKVVHTFHANHRSL